MRWWKKIFRRGPRDPLVDTGGNYESVVLPNSAHRPSAGASCSDDASGREALADEARDYYYPNMDKDGATEALRSRTTGTFLLRPSQFPAAAYTLSVRSERHVFNVRIFRNDGGYYLDGPVTSRKYFPTISALLLRYSQQPRELIAMCGVDEQFDERTSFKLLHPLSRSESALNTLHLDVGPRNEPSARRPARDSRGGSLKLMRQWL